jgi:hypothetical protein
MKQRGVLAEKDRSIGQVYLLVSDAMENIDDAMNFIPHIMLIRLLDWINAL